jgi:hypothetical protein
LNFWMETFGRIAWDCDSCISWIHWWELLSSMWITHLTDIWINIEIVTNWKAGILSPSDRVIIDSSVRVPLVVKKIGQT